MANFEQKKKKTQHEYETTDSNIPYQQIFNKRRYSTQSLSQIYTHDINIKVECNCRIDDLEREVCRTEVAYKEFITRTLLLPVFPLLLVSLIPPYSARKSNNEEAKDISHLISFINGLQQRQNDFSTSDLNQCVQVFSCVYSQLVQATNTAATTKTSYNLLVAKASISLIDSEELIQLDIKISKKISRLIRVTQSLVGYLQVPKYDDEHSQHIEQQQNISCDSQECQDRQWVMFRLLVVQSVVQVSPCGSGKDHVLIEVEDQLKSILFRLIPMLGSLHISHKCTKDTPVCPFEIKPEIVIPANNTRVCTVRLLEMLLDEQLDENDPLQVKCSKDWPESIPRPQSSTADSQFGGQLSLKGDSELESGTNSNQNNREYKLRVSISNEQQRQDALESTTKIFEFEIDDQNGLNISKKLLFYRHSTTKKSKGKIYLETSMMHRLSGNRVPLREITLDFNNIESTIRSMPFMLLTHPSTEDEKYRPIQLAKVADVIDRMCYWKAGETRPECSLNTIPVTFMHRDQNGCPYNPGPLFPTISVGRRASERECCAVLSQYAVRILGFDSPKIVSDRFLTETIAKFLSSGGNKLPTKNRYDIVSVRKGYYEVCDKTKKKNGTAKKVYLSLFNMTIGQLVDMQPSACSSIKRPIDRIRQLVFEKFILIQDPELVIPLLHRLYDANQENVVLLRFCQYQDQCINMELVEDGIFRGQRYVKKNSTAHGTETPYDRLFKKLWELAGNFKLVQRMDDTANPVLVDIDQAWFDRFGIQSTPHDNGDPPYGALDRNNVAAIMKFDAEKIPSKMEGITSPAQPNIVPEQTLIRHIPRCTTGISDNGPIRQRDLPGFPALVSHRGPSPINGEIEPMNPNEMFMDQNGSSLMWPQDEWINGNCYPDTDVPCSSNSLNIGNQNPTEMVRNGSYVHPAQKSGFMFYADDGSNLEPKRSVKILTTVFVVIAICYVLIKILIVYKISEQFHLHTRKVDTLNFQ